MENPNVYYFVSDTSDDSFHNLKLVALFEEETFYVEDKETGMSYSYIEEIDFFSHKKLDEFQTSRFKIDFGKNGCHGHGAKNLKELRKSIFKNSFSSNFKEVSNEKYLKIRSFLFSTYQEEMFMDFAKLPKEKIKSSKTSIL